MARAASNRRVAAAAAKNINRVKESGKEKLSIITFENPETPADCLKFVAKFFTIAVSHLLAARQLLHTSYFYTAILKDCGRVRYLKHDLPQPKKIWRLIDGAQAAIQQQYLSQFMIVVGNNAEDIKDASEVYCFKVEYADRGASIVMESPERKKLDVLKVCGDSSINYPAIKEALSSIRHIFRDTMSSRNDDNIASVSFRITYTDDTPKEYHPEGYFPGDDILFNMENPEVVPIAAVGTAHASSVLSVFCNRNLASMIAQDVQDHKHLPPNETTLNETVGAERSIDCNATLHDAKSPGGTKRLN